MFSQINVLYPKPANAMVSGTSTPVADQSLTVSTSAVAPTGYSYPNVQLVTFDVQTAAVRVRWDGTNPTGTTGHLLPIGGGYTWNVQQYNAAKFIRDSAAAVDGVVVASAMQV